VEKGNLMARGGKLKKKVRIGVVGVRRGLSFARGAGEVVGMKLVALCDTWEEKLNKAAQEFKVTTYSDYEKFLEHDIDAVILANYFHQHAPFAIKALKAGKHVMSETSACFTLAEGVALVEAVENGPKQGLFLGASSSITPGTKRENIKALIEGLKYYREHGRP
jgi:predicted dehydrogenase